MCEEKKRRARKGFTLVELVVVIAVLAILAGVGSVAYSGYITRANEAKDLSNLSAIVTAAETACVEEDGTVTEITVSLKASDGKNVIEKVNVKTTLTTGGFDIYGGTESGHTKSWSNFSTFLSDITTLNFSEVQKWTWKDGEWTNS